MLLGNTNGNGTFKPPVGYDATGVSQSVAAGDFNHDGKLELAVVNRILSTVSVLFGSSNGTFQAPMNYDMEVDPLSVAVGDFNCDGRLDLAVANASLFDDAGSSVSGLLGNSNGTFQASSSYAAGTSPRSVVGDFDGDGIHDKSEPDKLAASR